MKLLYSILFLVLFSSIASAQLGNRYFHVDSINVSTSSVTTTYSESWEVATIYADTVDIMVRVGAPDVGSWTSRDYFRLNVGMALTIGPTPKLKQIAIYTTNGTGVVYIIGYKKTRQF